MSKRTKHRRQKSERMIFTLPRSLADDIRLFADGIRGSNKSGFVADAVRWYVDYLRKTRHTSRLRESYARSAERSHQICNEWLPLDQEVWAKLDEIETHPTKAN